MSTVKLSDYKQQELKMMNKSIRENYLKGEMTKDSVLENGIIIGVYCLEQLKRDIRNQIRKNERKKLSKNW